MPQPKRAEQLTFTSDTKEKAAYDAYIEECAQGIATINADSLEDYDPFAVPEADRTAFDKFLMAFKTIEKNDPDLAEDIKESSSMGGYRRFGAYKNLLNTPYGFASVFGDMIRETVRHLNNNVLDGKISGFFAKNEEQQKLLSDFAMLFLPTEPTPEELAREEEQKQQERERELEQRKREREAAGLGDELDPETVKPAVQAHAKQAFDVTLRLMDTEKHRAGSDLYTSMRNSVTDLRGEPGEWKDADKERAVKNCLAYIQGKESHRWTESGRERFQMAMTTLGALLPPEDFQKEIDRVNRVRAGRWFGLGGPQLKAEDFTSKESLVDLTKAAKGLNDYCTDCEESRQNALEYAKKKEASYVQAYLAKMVAACELGGEKGYARIDDVKEQQLVDRANEIIGGKGFFDKRKDGMSYLAEELTEKPELAEQLLGDGTKDPMEIGRAVAKKAAEYELTLVTRNCAEVLGHAKRDRPTRDEWLAVESQLAKLTAAGLMARERRDGQFLDLRSLNKDGGMDQLEKKTEEVKNQPWFKATMANLTVGALPNGTNLSTITEQARTGKVDALLSACDAAKEMKQEELQQRADQYDVDTWRKVKLANGKVIGIDTPAGQLQLAEQKAREAKAVNARTTAATELLAARLVADKYKDKLFEPNPETVELKKSLMTQIQKSPDRKKKDKTPMDQAIEQCHDAVKAVRFKSNEGEGFFLELTTAVKEQDMGKFMDSVSTVAQKGKELNEINKQKKQQKKEDGAPKIGS